MSEKLLQTTRTPLLTARELAEYSEPKGKKVNYPTAQQQAVIEGAPIPTLVIAGAGAGKTETMSQRVLYLLSNYGLDPSRVLGLSFTRKAAKEFSTRLRKRIGYLAASGALPEAAGDPWYAASVNASTYDSFAGSLVKEHGILTTVTPGAQLITKAASWQIVDGILSTYRGKLPHDKASDLRTTIVQLAGQITSHGVEETDFANYLGRTRAELEAVCALKGPKTALKDFQKIIEKIDQVELLLPLLKRFKEYKQNHNLLDFADQMQLALEIVRQHPEVVTQIRGDYDAVLLDEFQDTSVNQMELLSTLFKDMSVTAVGDPNQAIYGWRGASAASLDLFHPMFSQEITGATLSLSTAWRNQPRILDVANVIAKPLAEKTYPGAEVITLQAAPHHPEGSGKVHFLYPETDYQEYDLVAQTMKAWKETYRDPETGVNSETYAVLARKKEHFAPLLEAFERHGLQASVVGLSGLVTQPAILDLRAILTACINPLYGPAVMRIVTNLDLPARDLKLLHTWAKELAKSRNQHTAQRTEFLLDAIDQPPAPGWATDKGTGFTERSHQQVKQLGIRLSKVREILDYDIPYILAKTIRLFDLDVEVAADPFVNHAPELFDAFLEVASSYQAESEHANLKNFLEWVETTVDAEDGLKTPALTVEPGVIQIMTVHQAKGLEWDRVAVVGLVEGSFPGYEGAHFSAKKATNAGLKEPFVFEHRPLKGWVTKVDELPYPLRQDYRFPTGENPDYPANAPILPQFPEFTGDDLKSNAEILADYFMQLAEHSEKEERRVAYVAFTRPKKELLLSGSWYKNGAKSIRIPSRYLQEAVFYADAQPTPHPLETEKDPIVWHRNLLEEIIAWEIATTRIFPRTPGHSRQLVNDSAKRVTQLIHQYLETPLTEITEVEFNPANQAQAEMVYSVQRALEAHKEQLKEQTTEVTVERLSATSATALLTDPEEFALRLRRPLPQQPSTAAALGTIFHQWAQTWCQKASSGELNEPLQTENAETSLETPDEVLYENLSPQQQKKLAQFQKRAKEIFTAELPTVVGLEIPFSFPHGKTTIRGQIDVLAKNGDKWKVIDWKTGAPPHSGKLTAEKEKQLAAYLGQLTLYRKAIAHQQGIAETEIAAELIFLGGADTIPIEERKITLADLEEKLPHVNIDHLFNTIFTQS